MNLKFSLKYKLYQFVQPLSLRLQSSVQSEIDRVKRADTLAKGSAKWT